jgi:hypothetical protein
MGSSMIGAADDISSDKAITAAAATTVGMTDILRGEKCGVSYAKKANKICVAS